MSQFKCQLKQPPVAAAAAVLRVMLLHIIRFATTQWKSSCQLNFVRLQQFCKELDMYVSGFMYTYSKLRHACYVCWAELLRIFVMYLYLLCLYWIVLSFFFGYMGYLYLYFYYVRVIQNVLIEWNRKTFHMFLKCFVFYNVIFYNLNANDVRKPLCHP